MVDALTLLTYTKITGNLVGQVADSNDADDAPQYVPLTGTVTFTPDAPQKLVRVLGGDKHRTVALTPVVATLDSAGDITTAGNKWAKILSPDNPYLDIDGEPFTYTVTFNVALNGVAVTIPAYSFNAVSGATLDLADIVPVVKSAGVITTKGPQGNPGPVSNGIGIVDQVNSVPPDVNGDVTLTLDNIPETSTRVAMSPAERSKLSGIAAGATQNTDTAINALADARIAASSVIVRTTGNQTVAGVKTFSSAPIVPDASFTPAKISGLDAYIDARIATGGGSSGGVLTNTVAPAITGTATTGSTLTSTNGSWTPAPDSYAYQWRRANTSITGATSATYTLAVADEGQAITCRVTATKAGYTSVSATSAAVIPAAPATGGGTGGTTFVSGTTKPDATNTGYGKEGRTATLTPYSGDYTVSASNQTIQNLDISGRVTIGSGVTGTRIINCRIRGGYTGSSEVSVINCSSGSNTTIEFCEISHSGNWGGINGIGTKNFTIRRCNIHNVVDGIRVNTAGSATTANPAATIEDNYIHDLILRTPDPLYNRSDNKTHSDGVQVQGGSNIRIFGNTIRGYHSTDGSSNVTNVTGSDQTPTSSGGTPFPQTTSAIMFSADTPPITNTTVSKNWIGGGAVSINHRNEGTGTISGNRFDRGSFLNTPIYPSTSSTFTISGNVYEDNGASV